MAQDFIEEAQQEAKLRFGRELSPEELVEKFAGHDFEARIFHLKNIDGQSELTVREAARRHPYTSALRRTHAALTKAGR
jgi:hypothetical protein